MSHVTHVFERADKAARTVDPMMLAQALDHIAKTAARSKSQTRRIRWIEQRALMALDGREYSDADLDLPRNPGPDTVERLRFRVTKLKVNNAALLEALIELEAMAERYRFPGGPIPDAQQKARAAIASATVDAA